VFTGVAQGSGVEAQPAAATGDGSDGYLAERKHNPFVRSLTGARILSALMLPHFTLRPPAGFGVITTTGRKTGKTRRKCVRTICRGDKVYLVSIPGARAAWLKNIAANPNVCLRIRGGRFSGVARELHEGPEKDEAVAAYCETVNRFDYAECTMHRPGRPTRSKIKELHRTWCEQGIPLVVELEERRSVEAGRGRE
jgi:deazaflavin-dependent oxidoreductase (nitroreductase family)